ncbi:hypothetical protein F5Y05DRAFT_190442 [Hypoxylon sp. FL0543]|nr:hypothetical protein F5Y05DRAFT_190442 [Hypoxylon sp. FL0543]
MIAALSMFIACTSGSSEVVSTASNANVVPNTDWHEEPHRKHPERKYHIIYACSHLFHMKESLYTFLGSCQELSVRDLKLQDKKCLTYMYKGLLLLVRFIVPHETTVLFLSCLIGLMTLVDLGFH